MKKNIALATISPHSESRVELKGSIEGLEARVFCCFVDTEGQRAENARQKAYAKALEKAEEIARARGDCDVIYVANRSPAYTGISCIFIETSQRIDVEFYQRGPWSSVYQMSEDKSELRRLTRTDFK